MKKIVSVFLILAMLLPCVLSNADFSSLDDFYLKFCEATEKTGANHTQIDDLYKMDWSEGGEYDAWVVPISLSLNLMVFVKHGTDQVARAVAGYSPKGQIDEKYDFRTLIAEVLYASGAIENVEETGYVLSQLQFRDNLNVGDSNKIEFNGMEISYSVAEVIGVMFFVAAMEESKGEE